MSSSSGGIDVKTLAVTAAASATAAYVCSKIWAPGTLASAAFTPVVIALLKEAYAKPTEVVVRAVPVRGTVRGSTGPGEESAGPVQPPAEETRRVAQPGEVAGPSRSMRRRHWRMAIATGVLGFLVAVIVITVPEVIVGKSASGGGRQTTLFGGSERKSSEREETQTTTGERTVTVPPAQTVTVPPAQTVTVPPADTEVPPTDTEVPPAATVTVPPTETTPAP